MTNEEQIQLVNLLKKLQSGLLPFDIFMELARLTVLPIIEVVPLRHSDKGVEIALLPRDKSDPLWPEEVHIPGTVIRPYDGGDMSIGLKRIDTELNKTETSLPVFVQNELHKSKRGWEMAFVYWVEVLGELKAGEFYDASNLPDNIIDSQINFINQAVKNFKQEKRL